MRKLAWKPDNLQTLETGKNLRTPRHLVLQVLLFIGVLFYVLFVESIPVSMMMLPRVMISFMGLGVDATQAEIRAVQQAAMQILPNEMQVMLYSTVLATILVILFCRFLENRPLRSMGFTKKNAVRDYLLGTVLGIGFIAAVVLICVLTGTLQYTGTSFAGSGLYLPVILGGWLLQGMSEEVIFRGYCCTTLAKHHSVYTASLISALLFAVMHLANDGVTVLAFLNLTLFGLFAAFYMFRFDSIWGCCAIHSFWNFAQGNLFGIKVSGMPSDISIFSFTASTDSGLINGGAFGLEGGLGVTLVMGIGIALLLLVPRKRTTA